MKEKKNGNSWAKTTTQHHERTNKWERTKRLKIELPYWQRGKTVLSLHIQEKKIKDLTIKEDVTDIKEK